MTCEHCGAGLPAFALFCGECGRSVAASPLVTPVTPVSEPVTTVAAEPVAWEPVATVASEPVATEPVALEPVASVPVATEPEPTVAPEQSTFPPPPRCATCGEASEPDDRFCAGCGAPLEGATRIIEPLVAQPVAPPSAPIAPPTPEPLAPPVLDGPMGLVAEESTRIVPRGTGGARFVLQFSTGESYTVFGSGLAGRNPRPEPGEYVDHLVTIVDPGRSVSKTHFEFGQEAGVLWFADRHSGNGSVIREPGAPARPCIPGHRYPIVRGTRIDIGEQFVVVS